MKKSFFLVFVAITAALRSVAHEGMWIPAVLGSVYDEMQGMGLKLSKEQLYAVNQSSLKDAVALFGGGCTAEVVSQQGLLFTNHHCGFDMIQYHSSLERDYLTYGFWANTMADELPCPGLTATFVVSMEDVTEKMLKGISENTSSTDADALKQANRARIEQEARNSSGLEATVRAFNYGNQYFLIITRTFKDVRLVGAPPGAIGKFGGDTDNWVWPRHTGDFSVFRIYADKDNQPAAYAKDNQPYVPAHHFPISLTGVKEGDFSMIYGFPGRTEHLLTSYAVEYIEKTANPLRIKMRDASLAIIGEEMDKSDKVRIQYAAKQSSIANAWKKWIGQNMGLARFNALDEKRKLEAQFQEQVKGGKEMLEVLRALYAENADFLLARDAFTEYWYYGPEIFNFAFQFKAFIDDYASLKASGKLDETRTELKRAAREFFKDFDLTTEKRLFKKLTPIYMAAVKPELGPSALTPFMKEGVEKACEAVYGNTLFTDSTACLAFIDGFDGSKKSLKKVAQAPAFGIAKSLMGAYASNVAPSVKAFNSKLEPTMCKYVKALRESGLDKLYWNDANSTLRIGFGKVEGSSPRDGVEYIYYSTADGILLKNASGAVDYELLPDLKKKLERREYGRYGVNGDLRVCYTGSNHTTGGNSGSPALNANGELVGINFDRSWESTMSDIYYSPEICRNIMVDIRYVLWVIDEYANCDRLIGELTFR